MLGNKYKAKRGLIVLQEGFTLIELLVVVSIIGLLSSMVLVTTKNARMNARDSRRIADMHQLYNAINLYLSANTNVPNCNSSGYTGGCDLSIPALFSGAVDSSQDGIFVPFLATYMKRTMRDPINVWPNIYIYAYNAEYPTGSGRRYNFLIGTVLENPNNPALRQSIGGGASVPGGPTTAYMLGERR